MSTHVNPSSSQTPQQTSNSVSPTNPTGDKSLPQGAPFHWSREWLIIVLLVLSTLAAYKDIGRCGFVNFDDPSYVFDEPMVNSGLRSASFVWAFSSTHNSNWHPLTSLSHMLDCSLFGIAPAPMHWENVAWHCVNAVLVFIVWRRLTRAVWRPAIVAALFAVHPLHVESVAWISERKDVLSAFFFLLTLWAYVRHTETRLISNKPSRFLIFAAVFFALGLMAKPMLVTLPCVLLLLDYWPLQRNSSLTWKQLFAEKIPFFVLALISSLITYFAQRSTGAMRFGTSLGLLARLENGIVSYVRYLAKTFWPEQLAIYYPHPGAWSYAAVLGALTFLLCVTAVAIWRNRTRPSLAFGWLWFLGTLVPVIGFIQVGGQAMADRYTYIPLLGIFTLVAWLMGDLAIRLPKSAYALTTIIVVIIACCVHATRKQVLVWRDGITLFEHNLVATPPNARAHLYLADALEMAGRPEREVSEHCHQALTVEPDCLPTLKAHALMQLSRLARQNHQDEEARAFLDQAQHIEPNNAEIQHALGMMSLRPGHPEEAIKYFDEALRLNPSQGATHRILAEIYFRRRRLDDSRAQLEAALQADRWDFLAQEALGLVLKQQGLNRQSREAFERALWINPRCTEAKKFFSYPN